MSAKAYLVQGLGVLDRSLSIWAHQFGGPGLFSVPKLTDLYRTPSMLTFEKSSGAWLSADAGHGCDLETAAGRRGDNLKRAKDFCLEIKASMWVWLCYMSHIRRSVKRFQGGLVFKAHRLLYRSTLDLRVIKKKICSTSEPWSSTQPMSTIAAITRIDRLFLS